MGFFFKEKGLSVHNFSVFTEGHFTGYVYELYKLTFQNCPNCFAPSFVSSCFSPKELGQTSVRAKGTQEIGGSTSASID